MKYLSVIASENPGLHQLAHPGAEAAAGLGGVHQRTVFTLQPLSDVAVGLGRWGRRITPGEGFTARTLT